jgi:hypothetical protein
VCGECELSADIDGDACALPRAEATSALAMGGPCAGDGPMTAGVGRAGPTRRVGVHAATRFPNSRVADHPLPAIHSTRPLSRTRRLCTAHTPRRNGAAYREGAGQLRGAGRWVNTAQNTRTLAEQPQLPLLTSSSTSSPRRPRRKSNWRASPSTAMATTTSMTWSTALTTRPRRSATARRRSST